MRGKTTSKGKKVEFFQGQNFFCLQPEEKEKENKTKKKTQEKLYSLCEALICLLKALGKIVLSAEKEMFK